MVHVFASLEHILTGYFISLLLGFVTGIYFFTGAGKIIITVFDWLRSIPAIALFPVFIYTVGNGWEAKSLIIFWTSFPVFSLGVYSALHGVDRDVREAALLDGCTILQALYRIAIPASFPAIIIAARSAFGSALIGTTAAEMLGSSKGLGYFIMASSQTFKFADMFYGIFLLGMIGVILNYTYTKLYERMEN